MPIGNGGYQNMENMVLTILIVWVITLLAWYLNLNGKISFRICPICAGISGTWLILSAGIVWGFFSADYKILVAMLMAGTVVGVAFQGQENFPWAQKNIFYWKVPTVILGLPLAYFLLTNLTPLVFGFEVLLVGLAVFFFSVKNDDPKNDLEKIKNCC